jgi:hypothetical protein
MEQLPAQLGRSGQHRIRPDGIYSALGATTATIDDLSFASEPVGVTFPEQFFISFDADPTLSRRGSMS